MTVASDLADSYASALASYLDGDGEVALQHAYEVGRRALASGLSPLVLFSIHRDVVRSLPAHSHPDSEFVSLVTTVFIETLGPFQMADASVEDARAAVQELGSLIDQHTNELAGGGQDGEQRPASAEAGWLESTILRHVDELDQVRSRLETARRAAETRRRLLADIVGAQEQERRRIANEIHDDAVQEMTAVLLRLHLLRTTLRDPEQLAVVEQLEASVGASIGRLRRLIAGLQPPELDRVGLVVAVRSALNQLKSEFGLEYGLEARGATEPGLEARVISFRIFQEALANLRKHGGASRVEVLLDCGHDGVLARIRDNGVGFDVEAALDHAVPGHLGLATMRERADLVGGWLRVTSGKSGTSVEFWIPYAEPSPGTT